MVKYSFVVPVYKKEKYLKKTVESLLSQDYKEIEVVCVLDGFSEEAMGILSKIKDKRLQTHVIEHGGASKARNEGFKKITGDYVCFWDADCYAEPGMVRVWTQIYETMKDVDFIYSGYKWSDPNKLPYDSEEFNPWKLTCNNYICSMTVMRKEIFPGWDESLKSLQDWDLFLTLTEKGYKGYLNRGYAFITEYPEKGSISFENCKDDVWLDRKKTVREKHGIKDRNICLTSFYHVYKAYDVAQMLGGDFDMMPSYHKHDYKMIYKIGFYGQEGGNASKVFQGASKECIKVIHWQSKDIESLQDMSYRGVRLLVAMLNKYIDHHFCENEILLRKLQWLGINSPRVILLPVDYHDIDFPKEFSVCYDGDPNTVSFLKSVEKAMPDIKFYDTGVGNFKSEDVACYLGMFGEYYSMDNFKKFISAGRYVVTNFQLPFSGYIADDNDMEKLKIRVIEKIRELQKKYEAGERNTRAKDYWCKQLNKETFKQKVNELKKVVQND